MAESHKRFQLGYVLAFLGVFLFWVLTLSGQWAWANWVDSSETPQNSIGVQAAAYNVTTSGLNALNNYSSLIPLVGILLLATIVIGLLLGAFRCF